METQDQIKHILGDLKIAAPAGYALAFHVKYTTPTYLFQTYPADWLEYYSNNGLLLQDPTVAWGFENTGLCDWSELTASDDAGVLGKAAEYGMTHGICYATVSTGKRSLGSFTRSDRPFTDEETAKLTKAMDDLDQLLAQAEDLSPETAAELRRMSVVVTRG